MADSFDGSHPYGNPYANYRHTPKPVFSGSNFGKSGDAPSFSGAKFGGLEASGVNDHDISVESLDDVHGTSHILNAAAVKMSQPRTSGWRGDTRDVGSPIVGDGSFPGKLRTASRQGTPRTQRPPLRPSSVELPSRPYGMTAEPIPQIENQADQPVPGVASDPTHPLTGGLVKRAIGDAALTGRVMPKGFVPPIGEI